MNTKKIAGIASFIAVLACVNFANAADHWTPLVRIPGLPATGHVDLSMYLVGLYNFLLSIVGIVAVMMLIIGGMRYITAAGNSAAISDAKDIVSNAIIGLLLALLSWVFIATINPDVLYIKQPGSGFNTTDVHGACYKSYDFATSTCICIDTVDISPRADRTACNDDCYDLDHCKLPDSYPCIAIGSPNDFTDPNFKNKSTYNKRCKCVDDVYVTPNWVAIDATPGAETCNDVCSNPAFAADVLSHCYVVDFRIGKMNIDGNYFSSDKERAKKYALYSAESMDTALDFTVGAPDSCYLAVNGADYTTKFNEVTKMVLDNGATSFDGDCNNPLNMNIFAPWSPSGVSGYIGPFLWLNTCPFDGINSIYGTWETDVNCRKIEDPKSVICPIKLCVEWNGGAIKKEKIMYLQMLDNY